MGMETGKKLNVLPKVTQKPDLSVLTFIAGHRSKLGYHHAFGTTHKEWQVFLRLI